jgi:hypothetical protein
MMRDRPDIPKKAGRRTGNRHMTPTMKRWTVCHIGFLVVEAELITGGVEMEEKGERYRDGDKVCVFTFADAESCELTVGATVLREVSGPV